MNQENVPSIEPKRRGKLRLRLKQRGVALVTVMSILAVLTILSVAIISLAGNELKSATAYSENVRVRQLSETVISLVIGQLREATRPDSDAEGGNAKPTLWASQPGMIRTWKSSGEFGKAYRLYSASRMTTEKEEDLKQELTRYVQWQTAPHRFVDLNRPAIEFDVRGKEVDRIFPIIDPRAKDKDKVEGFNYEVGAIPGVQPDKSLPMPVEWMYMLRNGALGTLDTSGKFTSTDPRGQPSKENPLVARLAFWADDETTKINVNTAAEAAPWYTPLCYAQEAKNYSQIQPVGNEVTRYPGHPAMTCLSAVFFPGQYIDGRGADQLSERQYTAILELAPKVNIGGTDGGKKRGNARLEYDKDRLYASVDDVIFNIQREENHFLRELPDGIERFERAKGFLTTRSSAPELNIFGRPRIGMWPIHESAGITYRTPYDDTIAFCTTLRAPRGSTGNKGDKYYFVRADASSRHGEFYGRDNRANVNLYKFLMHQVYRPVPGYGGSLANKYGSNKPAPFKSTYYRDNNEYFLDHFSIGLQMLDYLRCTNIHDGNVKQQYADFQTSASFGQIAGINLIGRNLDSDDGSSQQSSNWYKPTLEPKGHGRLFTISEVSLVLYSTATATITQWPPDGVATKIKFGARGGGSPGDAAVIEEILRNKHPRYAEWYGRKFGSEDVGKKFHFVEAGIVPEVFCAAQGFHQIHPRQTLRLLNGGTTGNRKGLSDFAGSLRLHPSNGGTKGTGVPLELWGDSDDSKDTDQIGPLLMAADPSKKDVREDLPKGWFGFGGPGGYRLMRFGDFKVPNKKERGFYGANFLANGTGPLAAWYCQTPVIVRDDQDIILTQKEPVQIVIYDTIPDRTSKMGTNNGNIVQNFNLRWAMPGEEVKFKRPNPSGSDFAGWTRRFSRAAEANARKTFVDVFEGKNNTELAKSLIVSHGDYRHVSARRNIPSEMMRPHPYSSGSKEKNMAMSMTEAIHPKSSNPGKSPQLTLADDIYGRNLAGQAVRYEKDNRPDFTFDPKNEKEFSPLMSPSYNFPIDPSITRDFDNGVGSCVDGPYINKADDGADDIPGAATFGQNYPYFEVGEWKKNQSYDDRNLENFSPNRMIPSPVVFGSLPSAMQANAPWTCLLFRPNVSDPDRFPHLGEKGNGLNYSGTKKSVDGFDVPQFNTVRRDKKMPPDHIWLDFFWMPVVEPYPISEPFSTSGKVNLNYQMMPFSYIKRATALHAVLKSERILAIPNAAGAQYKRENSWKSGYYHKIDGDETMKQWEHKFKTEGTIFKTASEVCEMFLYPKFEVRWDEENKAIRHWWDDHRLTGDNSLEKPYANIYPRVTTKSNTFRVFMTVQTLRKVRGTPPSEFVVDKDQVTGEYRGSAVVERYLDPNDPEMPQYKNTGQEANADTMEYFYRYRIVNNRQFSK